MRTSGRPVPPGEAIERRYGRRAAWAEGQALTLAHAVASAPEEPGD